MRYKTVFYEYDGLRIELPPGAIILGRRYYHDDGAWSTFVDKNSRQHVVREELEVLVLV